MGRERSDRFAERERGLERDRDVKPIHTRRQPAGSEIYSELLGALAMSSGQWKSVLLMVLLAMGPRDSGGFEVVGECGMCVCSRC